MNSKGVTIVELLIVIIIISIISGFTVTAVSQILENSKQKAFIATANTMITSARLSYAQEDDSWNENKITLGDLIRNEYIVISDNDPWGGLYDLDESYVTVDASLTTSDEIWLSTNTATSLVEVNNYSVKLVSTTATLGFDSPLNVFDVDDIVFVNGDNTVFETIVEMFDNDLDSDYTTNNGNDEVNVVNDITDNAIINLEGGNDTLNIGDDVEDGSTINMGDGDDVINMDGEVTGSSNINTGSGNDTVTIDDDIQNNSTVSTGDGDDTVTVNDDLQNGAVLDTGSGNDIVYVNDELDQGTIKTGSGNDTITVERIVRTSYVYTGDGDDTMTINNVSSTFDNGSVSMGSGNDTLTLKDTLSGTKATWYGGDGEDVLNLPDLKKKDWGKISKYFTGFETINFKDGSISNN